MTRRRHHECRRTLFHRLVHCERRSAIDAPRSRPRDAGRGRAGHRRPRNARRDPDARYRASDPLVDRLPSRPRPQHRRGHRHHRRRVLLRQSPPERRRPRVPQLPLPHPRRHRRRARPRWLSMAHPIFPAVLPNTRALLVRPMGPQCLAEFRDYSDCPRNHVVPGLVARLLAIGDDSRKGDRVFVETLRGRFGRSQ